MRKVLSLLTVLLILISDLSYSQSRQFFVEPTLSLKIEHKNKLENEFEAGSDHLTQYLSIENFPVMYSRNFRTEVCYDNQCRLLNVNLYWNVTGRYLGYELPKREYLSKAEHEKFTDAEYNRLGKILANQFSPLGSIQYEALVPNTELTKSEVDAVSSATAKNLLDYVVQGAAYTTYKMWHFVYGDTQQKVIKLTEEKLTPTLIIKILEGPDSNDKIWALNHVKGYVEMTPLLKEKLLCFINNDSYSYAERALNAISSEEILDTELQLMLVGKIQKTDYSIQKLIIKKLMDASHLSKDSAALLAANLDKYSGEIIRDVLILFKKNKVYDSSIIIKVAQILKTENSFISKLAYDFLKSTEIDDLEIKSQLKNYKNN